MIKWIDSNQIQITPPKHTKKVTGTRLATIRGLNPWSTPFEMWCAITKTYEKPFEDTIYTIAGKTIEPKQAEYMEKAYGMSLITPTDRYGADYFNKTWGDFFPENKRFGGMWDYLGVNEYGVVDTVFEMKTTKRIEDWQNDVPEYYALQAALYAWLLGVDRVIMVASFLEENDYITPSNFVPSVENTITVEFNVSERYPNFSSMVQEVEDWWVEHIETGISPVYDEKKDAEILNVLRTNTLTSDTDINVLIKEAESLKQEIDLVADSTKKKEKRLEIITDLIKQYMSDKFRKGDERIEIKGEHYTWTCSLSEVSSIDKEALQADGLLDKYQRKSSQYRLTVK